MNGYTLTKEWFTYARNNLDKVECKHTATYLYIVELFNQNQWVKVLGLPTDYTMASLNIKSYKTYKKILDDLESFNKIKFIERSKNIFTSNKITLVKKTNASAKAISLRVESYTEEELKQSQGESTITNLYKPINKETIKPINLKTSIAKKTEKVFSEEVVNCFDECLVFFSEQLKPKNKTPWLDTIEKLNRIDNLHFSEITELVKKIRTDDFWVKNFQTITKLRSKNSDGISYHVYFTERFKHNTSSYKNNKNESKVHSNR